MRRTLWISAVLVVLVPMWALADDGDAIVGLWLTAPDEEDGQARVEVFKDGDSYNGKIVWLEKPVYPPDDDGGMPGQEKVDRENPDAELRNRPIQGLQIMFDFQYAGKNKWKKGTIYAPDEGKTYKCKATLTDDGSLKVRGFIGISMLGRTERWTRVEAEE
jgi:uncharacterized protein (DUF2147 family)